MTFIGPGLIHWEIDPMDDLGKDVKNSHRSGHKYYQQKNAQIMNSHWWTKQSNMKILEKLQWQWRWDRCRSRLQIRWLLWKSLPKWKKWKTHQYIFRGKWQKSRHSTLNMLVIWTLWGLIDHLALGVGVVDVSSAKDSPSISSYMIIRNNFYDIWNGQHSEEDESKYTHGPFKTVIEQRESENIETGISLTRQ